MLVLLIKHNFCKIFNQILQFSICLILINIIIIFYYNYFKINEIDFQNDIQNRKLIVQSNDENTLQKLLNIKEIDKIGFIIESDKIYINNNIEAVHIFDYETESYSLKNTNTIKNNEVIISSSLYNYLKEKSLKLKIDNEEYNMEVIEVEDSLSNYIILSHNFIKNLIESNNIKCLKYEIIVKKYTQTNYVMKYLKRNNINAVPYYENTQKKYIFIKNTNLICKIFLTIILIFIIITMILLLKKSIINEKQLIILLRNIGITIQKIQKLFLKLIWIELFFSTICTILLLIYIGHYYNFFIPLKYVGFLLIIIIIILSKYVLIEINKEIKKYCIDNY